MLCFDLSTNEKQQNVSKNECIAGLFQLQLDCYWYCLINQIKNVWCNTCKSRLINGGEWSEKEISLDSVPSKRLI